MLRRSLTDRPGLWAGIVSAAIYLVLGYLLLLRQGEPQAPSFGPPLSVATALANGLTFAFLTVGWVAIRARRLRRHRTFMELAFLSIGSFLVLYVTRQFLAGPIAFEGPPLVRSAVYLPILITHLAVSAVSIPPVVYNFLVGLTRPLNRVGETLHPRVGRIIVPLWMASSLMGLVVFGLLQVYRVG